MTVRTVLRHERWILAPDEEPDAERPEFAMVCVVCEEHSECFDSEDVPRRWALRHSGRNPSHHTYREVVVRPWRTWTAPGPK